jgi:hypothetical protein
MYCRCDEKVRTVHLASGKCLACGLPVSDETYKEVMADYKKKKGGKITWQNSLKV